MQAKGAVYRRQRMLSRARADVHRRHVPVLLYLGGEFLFAVTGLLRGTRVRLWQVPQALQRDDVFNGLL